jgi:hypothetical protein
MKKITLITLSAASFCLTSCGLVKSAVQLPFRTLQTVGRGVGIGFEHSELPVTQDAKVSESTPKFELRP